MAILGHTWPCMAMYGHAWPYMAMSRHAWPCMAISTKMAISTNGQNGIAIYMAIWIWICSPPVANQEVGGHFTSPHAASPHIATGAPHQD